jgi:hypothetical protein
MQRLKGRWTVIVRLLVGAVVGGVLGYAVYRFIGCSTGTCPITSNPWISTIFGVVMGTLVAAPR